MQSIQKKKKKKEKKKEKKKLNHISSYCLRCGKNSFSKKNDWTDGRRQIVIWFQSEDPGTNHWVESSISSAVTF